MSKVLGALDMNVQNAQNIQKGKQAMRLPMAAKPKVMEKRVQRGVVRPRENDNVKQTRGQSRPRVEMSTAVTNMHETDDIVQENEQFCAIYLEDIFKNELAKEMAYQPEPGYLWKQKDMNSKMRSILVDWLIEVGMKYSLHQEVLYLTINLVDRYFSLKPIDRKKIQLVGVASMLIAAKYEEIYPPEIKDFSFITDHAYDCDEIIEMEIDILNTLNFNLTVTTPWLMLTRYLHICKVQRNSLQWHLAALLLESTMIDFEVMVGLTPSQLACAAVYLSSRITKDQALLDEIPSLFRYGQFDYEQIHTYSKRLARCFWSNCSTDSSLTALRRKYEDSDRCAPLKNAQVLSVLTEKLKGSR